MARQSTSALLVSSTGLWQELATFFSGATLPMSSMRDLFRRLPKRQTTKLVPEVSAKSGRQLPESSESSFRNWRDTKMSPEGANFSKLFRQKWIFYDCLEGPLMAWTSFPPGPPLQNYFLPWWRRRHRFVVISNCCHVFLVKGRNGFVTMVKGTFASTKP